MSARRLVISGVVTLMGLFASWNAAHAETEIVIAGWSGGYDKIFEEKLLADYLKENDIRLRWVLGSSVQNVARIKASQGSPEIDLAMVDDLPQRAALKDGLWESLDPTLVPNLEKLRDVARIPGDQGVSFAINISGLVYHPDVFKEKGLPLPTSWNDLYREDLKGRIALFPATVGEGLITLLALARLGGGDEHNIEPGFEMAKKLAPNVQFLSDAGTVASLFQTDEIWLSVDPLDYAQISKAKGVPIEFVFPKEGAPARTYTISVVKNGPNGEAAQKLVNALLSAEVQERLVGELGLAPVNREADVPADLGDMADRVYPVDVEHINASRQEWIERWNREVQSQ